MINLVHQDEIDEQAQVMFGDCDALDLESRRKLFYISCSFDPFRFTCLPHRFSIFSEYDKKFYPGILLTFLKRECECLFYSYWFEVSLKLPRSQYNQFINKVYQFVCVDKLIDSQDHDRLYNYFSEFI